MAGPNDELLISFKFGTLRYDGIPFLDCVDKVISFADVYQGMQDSIKKESNQNQWIVSFWSEVLAFKDPPTMHDWSLPRIRLGFATRAYERGNFDNAKKYLNQGVKDYNRVYKKWVTYTNALRGGAATAITIIEISAIVLTLGFGGAGAAGMNGARLIGGARAVGFTRAGTSFVKGAGYLTGMTFVEKTFLEIGKLFYGVDNKFDFASVAKDTLIAFVSSLVGGALSKLFIAKIQLRVIARMRAVGGPRLQSAISQRLTVETLPGYLRLMGKKGVAVPGATKLQKFLVVTPTATIMTWAKLAISKNAGKNVSAEDLVGSVADEIPDGVIDNIIRQSK